jgi:hypothetical protein
MTGFSVQDQPGPNIPAGTPGANTLRQYGSVPPVLAANNIPKVGTVTGLGTGGGAGAQVPSNGGYGTIEILAGSNPSTGGSIALVFPTTPPTLFISGSEGLGTLSQTTVTNTVTITWTAKPQAARRAHIYFEWATSK